MNVTFLIGNGFDIGMGLNSRFKDFFPIYQIKSNNKPDRIKMLSHAIEGDYETWADFETALGKYTLEFTSETKQDFIDQLRDFENDFMEYLESQEAMLSFDSVTQISEAIKRTNCPKKGTCNFLNRTPLFFATFSAVFGFPENVHENICFSEHPNSRILFFRNALISKRQRI